jgi:uncharacterized membrane protein
MVIRSLIAAQLHSLDGRTHTDDGLLKNGQEGKWQVHKRKIQASEKEKVKGAEIWKLNNVPNTTFVKVFKNVLKHASVDLNLNFSLGAPNQIRNFKRWTCKYVMVIVLIVLVLVLVVGAVEGEVVHVHTAT